MHVSLRSMTLGLLVLVASAQPASGHLPHDPNSTVALSPGSPPEKVISQYLYPGRPMLMVSDDDGRSWAYLAPPGMDTELTDIGFATTDVVFALGASDLAPFLSLDGGYTWEATNEPDGSPVMSMAISSDYQTLPRVFAGTGAGLAYSDDEGISWVSVSNLTGSIVRAVALSPDYPTDPTLFVLTDVFDIWRSTDDGVNWTQVFDASYGREPTAIALSPLYSASPRLWVGCEDGTVLYSRDSGDTWAESRIELLGQAQNSPINDLLSLDSSIVFAVNDDWAVFVSDSAGLAWDLYAEGLGAKTGQRSTDWGHYARLSASPDNPQAFALSSYEGLYRSPDGGMLWSESCTVRPAYVRAFEISPSYPDDPTVWIGTYGSNILRTEDRGQTFDVIGEDITHQFTEEFSVSPGFPDDPTMCGIFNRNLYCSFDGGVSFEWRDVPDTSHMGHILMAPDFPNSGVAYVSGANEALHWSFVRTDDHGRPGIRSLWAPRRTPPTSQPRSARRPTPRDTCCTPGRTRRPRS